MRVWPGKSGGLLALPDRIRLVGFPLIRWFDRLVEGIGEMRWNLAVRRSDS